MNFTRPGFFVTLILSSLLINCNVESQNNSGNTGGQKDSVEWLTIEEAVEMSKEQPRKIFVDVYTDWCGFCKRMNNNTYSHQVIIDILNNSYYPVKFNAEQEEPIVFQGNEFIHENPEQRRSAHEFAIAILQGQMSYPSVAFFDEEQRLITAIPGFRPPEKMEPILMFFYEDEYLDSSDMDNYMETFESRIE